VAVHLNAASRDELGRLKGLGAVATTNPISYLWRSASEEARKLAAPEQLLPHRSLVRLGIPFGLATDNKPADPWLAFAAVVARRDMASGAVLGPAERLTRIQALRALTVGGAWVTFAERERGTLAPGRQADLAVLEQDPLRLPLSEFAALSCRLAMVGGRIVHGHA
jgi:predicted amidohydrolase YtcJ